MFLKDRGLLPILNQDDDDEEEKQEEEKEIEGMMEGIEEEEDVTGEDI